MAGEGSEQRQDGAGSEAELGGAAKEPHDEGPVSIGDVLAGKYRVDRILGMGGMGVVVAATHLQLLERVALKFLRSKTQTRWTDRFLQEARAAVRLKSEHVARVLDVGTLESGAPFIVMEFLEGQTLGQLLRERGPLGIEESIGYVLQACEGIAEAHGKGIVHRDLKPENLFVSQRVDGAATVKILDFGIAKSIDAEASGMPLTQTQQAIGSPQYMSPEQLRASTDMDGRVDVWALGIILYECLTGRAPFTGKVFSELVLKIAQDTPPSPSHLRAEVPTELGEIVLRCLEKDADKRIPTIGDLAVALERFAPVVMRDMGERIRGVASRAGAVPSSPTLSGRPRPPTPLEAATTKIATSAPTLPPPATRAPKTPWMIAAIAATAAIAWQAGRSLSGASSAPVRQPSAVSAVTAPAATWSSGASPVPPIPEAPVASISPGPSVALATPSASASAPAIPSSRRANPASPQPHAGRAGAGTTPSRDRVPTAAQADGGKEDFVRMRK